MIVITSSITLYCCAWKAHQHHSKPYSEKAGEKPESVGQILLATEILSALKFWGAFEAMGHLKLCMKHFRVIWRFHSAVPTVTVT